MKPITEPDNVSIDLWSLLHFPESITMEKNLRVTNISRVRWFEGVDQASKKPTKIFSDTCIFSWHRFPQKR